MKLLDKLFGSAVLMVPSWALIVLAGWLGGFFAYQAGYAHPAYLLVAGTVVGVGGLVYKIVREKRHA